MKRRMFVFRLKTVKRSIALSLALICLGLSFIFPAKALAASDPFYLFPAPNNNPVQSTGLFWSEAHPEWGAHNMFTWNQKLPANQMKVIGIPEDYFIESPQLMVSDAKKGQNWMVAKFKDKWNQKGKNGKYDKDVFVYKRTISGIEVKEEIQVEVGKHFKSNDNFGKFLEQIRDTMTDHGPGDFEIPKPDAKNASLLAGGALLAGGTALLFKALMLVLLI